MSDTAKHDTTKSDKRWFVALFFGVPAAIVLFLAVIVVPNYITKRGSVYARVSQTQSEMVAVAHALEAYGAEHSGYPSTLAELTTPMAYLAEVPRDWFLLKVPTPLQYAPFRRGSVGPDSRLVYRGWVIYASGPDRKYDMVPSRDLPPDGLLDHVAVQKRLDSLTFDPSNGMKSAGDLFTLGGF